MEVWCQELKTDLWPVKEHQHWVRMTHLFPAAQKYGREAFPERKKIVGKANNWAQFLAKNIAEWSENVNIDTERGREQIQKNPLNKSPVNLYGPMYQHVLNSMEKLDLIDAGVDTDPVVIEVPQRSAEYVQAWIDEENTQKR